MKKRKFSRKKKEVKQREFNDMKLSVLSNDNQLSTAVFDTERVTITIGHTRYVINKMSDHSLRILKSGAPSEAGIVVVPEVSNVIRIK